jgi:hypothetical protein
MRGGILLGATLDDSGTLVSIFSRDSDGQRMAFRKENESGNCGLEWVVLIYSTLQVRVFA